MENHIMTKYKFYGLLTSLLITIGALVLVARTQAQIEPAPEPLSSFAGDRSFIPLVFSASSDLPPNETPTPTTPVSTQTSPAPTSITPAPADMILVDHRSVDLFDQIPEEYLAAARNTPMLFSDRSVGWYTDLSLNCLTDGLPPGDPESSNDWHLTPSGCRTDYYAKDRSTWLYKTFTENDFLNNLVPQRILFDPDPVRYDRSNWTYEDDAGVWQTIIQQFVQDLVPRYVDSKEILSFQFSYLNVTEDSTIDDAEAGFFIDHPHFGYYPNRERWDISDLEELEAQYPDKVFVYWTTSLARSIGTLDSANFNDQMRQYAIAHNKILFDFADIEAYDDNGNPCYDNRDGVEFCRVNDGICENYPDDRLDIPAICQDYTAEIDGGHFNNLSAGKIRVAKAFWVLMARIAGWNP
jgi:hypothetical protein